MKHTHNKLYYIGPSWIMVFIFAVCAIAFAFFVKFDIRSNLPIYSHFNKPAIFLSCVFGILSTASYTFYPDFFEVRILSITVRRIQWKDVTGAMYIRSVGRKRSSFRYNPYLIICILPCQPTDPCTVDFERFDRKNAQHLIRIPISGKEQEVFELMERLKINIKGIESKNN